MIDLRKFSNANHRTRLDRMENDLRYAIAIHEAGHVTMGQLHGIASEVHLPELAADYRSIAKNAHAVFNVGGLPVSAIVEICLGGYLAELAMFGDGEKVFVHADRSANDCIALIDRLRPVDFEPLQRNLVAGGDAAGLAVFDLARRYGSEAMAKTKARKSQLLANANAISNVWSSHRYGTCSLKIE